MRTYKSRRGLFRMERLGDNGKCGGQERKNIGKQAKKQTDSGEQGKM